MQISRGKVLHLWGELSFLPPRQTVKSLPPEGKLVVVKSFPKKAAGQEVHEDGGSHLSRQLTQLQW